MQALGLITWRSTGVLHGFTQSRRGISLPLGEDIRTLNSTKSFAIATFQLRLLSPKLTKRHTSSSHVPPRQLARGRLNAQARPLGTRAELETFGNRNSRSAQCMPSDFEPEERVQKTIEALVDLCEDSKIAYYFRGKTALLLQGMQLAEPLQEVAISIQWDFMKQVHVALQEHAPSPIRDFATAREHGASFCVELNETTVVVQCRNAFVIAADPGRVEVALNVNLGSQRRVWVQSVYSVREEAEAKEPVWAQQVTSHLAALQETTAAGNNAAWGDADVYTAWVQRFGPPEEWAAEIARNPWARLEPFGTLLGDVQGQKVVNLLGSHGTKAVALALLGAHPTVIDVSSSNAAYCQIPIGFYGLDNKWTWRMV
ncbi:hypothetical protein CYMTET_30177 [Cymbomonas tetramitiformis]|uniref:Uncharacterized protein n=1 Tax=Cymbomonas tetramitiformis TaxID=36881 RepID=A0AAE0FJG3_9CHLO|nr:hypothetical protein CYMTET_30177 [Cymbomonas tetramitiformis]